MSKELRKQYRKEVGSTHNMKWEWYAKWLEDKVEFPKPTMGGEPEGLVSKIQRYDSAIETVSDPKSANSELYFSNHVIVSKDRMSDLRHIESHTKEAMHQSYLDYLNRVTDAVGALKGYEEHLERISERTEGKDQGVKLKAQIPTLSKEEGDSIQRDDLLIREARRRGYKKGVGILYDTGLGRLIIDKVEGNHFKVADNGDLLAFADSSCKSAFDTLYQRKINKWVEIAKTGE